MADLFFPQSVLDDWVAQEKIQLDGTKLVLNGRTFMLEGAVHVLKCVSEDKDPYDIVHRVKKLEELHAQGADALETSLIFKEQAYEVDTGFIGHVEERAISREAVADAARARQIRRTMSIQIDSPEMKEALAAAEAHKKKEAEKAAAASAATAASAVSAEGRMRPVAKDKASQDAARIASEKLARDAAKAQAAGAGAGGGAGGKKTGSTPPAPAPAAAAPAPKGGAPASGKLTDEELLTNFLLENL
ncbi:MAG TPA: hypothetical protein VG389_28070 [Myxococcota bacterium]|jgi:hypothetical protein|nr:hypothetical protein [Myxococcota bacterium]